MKIKLIRKYLLKIQDVIDHKKILWRYVFLLKRIKEKVRSGQKIRVLFLATEGAKWNYDSLYNELKKDKLFEPLLLYSPRAKSEHQTESDIKKNYAFYKKRYPEIQLGYDIKTKTYVNLKIFAPDIVFYTQPWEIYQLHGIKKVSHYALTCYSPYPLAESPETLIVNLKKFHFNLWKHFVIADEVKEQYKKELNYTLSSIVVTGHPKLDVYLTPYQDSNKKYVIYAPHSSFPCNSWCKCATFEWNGLHILKYAQTHPEFNWVFKPHPDVYSNLIRNKIMTKQEVDEYYQAWNSLGLYYDTGDYFSIFQDSECLITDCISFLGEYFPTQKPVIHLRSKFTVNYMALNQEIIKHYYQAWDLKELDLHLKNILENKLDPMKQERLDCLYQMKLGTSSAAQNIINHIKQEIGA